jgi:hypothetical protein
MEQRVEFVNDELVITSNGAKTNSRSTTVDFVGDFLVDAGVVARLIAIFHKKNMAVCYPPLSVDRNWRSYYVSNEEMARVIKSFESEISGLKDDKAFARCELQSLKEKITEFNRTRKWYERKFEF